MSRFAWQDARTVQTGIDFDEDRDSCRRFNGRFGDAARTGEAIHANGDSAVRLQLRQAAPLRPRAEGGQPNGMPASSEAVKGPAFPTSRPES